MADIVVTNKTYDGIRRAVFKKEDGESVIFYNTDDATITPEALKKDLIAYGKDGQIVGTMEPYSGLAPILDSSHTSFSIPLGYHDGTSIVSIEIEEKTITPTRETQIIEPNEGKVFGTITIEAAEVTPTLIAKTIDRPGIFKASQDEVDGYNQVTVSFPVPIKIDVSRFESTPSEVIEYFSDDPEDCITYTFTFDEAGNPETISNGVNTCEFVWRSET